MRQSVHCCTKASLSSDRSSANPTQKMATTRGNYSKTVYVWPDASLLCLLAHKPTTFYQPMHCATVQSAKLAFVEVNCFYVLKLFFLFVRLVNRRCVTSLLSMLRPKQPFLSLSTCQKYICLEDAFRLTINQFLCASTVLLTL